MDHGDIKIRYPEMSLLTKGSGKQGGVITQGRARQRKKCPMRRGKQNDKRYRIQYNAQSMLILEKTNQNRMELHT